MFSLRNHAATAAGSFCPMLRKLGIFVVILSNITINSFSHAHAQEQTSTKRKQNNSRRFNIYSTIKITHKADFATFSTYMQESREEYRKRRSNELISHSTTALGTNTALVSTILQAYEKFDHDYTKYKELSRQGIDAELGNQLKAALNRMAYDNLLDNQKLNFAFANNFVSTPANDNSILENAVIYGNWSEYDKDNIQVTVFFEPIGHNIRTFIAVGDEKGEAMNNIASQIFLHLQGKKQYDAIINPHPQLSFKQPISIDDKKTHAEASAYCKSQSIGSNEEYRLPHASEIINMPGKFQSGGVFFVDANKNDYAIIDKRGTLSNYKLIANNSTSTARIQKAEDNEKLSYFCVKGTAHQSSLRTEELYKQMHQIFYSLKKHNNGKITKEACRDYNNKNNIEELKNLSLAIKKHDPSAQIKSMIGKCVEIYVKERFNPHDELALL